MKNLLRSLTLAPVLGLAVFASSATPALAAAPEEPATEAATALTATTATLNGALSPKSPGEPGGTYEFRYKASSTVSKTECESPGALKAPEPPAAAGEGEAEHVEIGIGSLTQGTEYVACLVETNAASESTFGPAVPFKTAVPPETPTTQPASEVKGTTAKFHGVLNPANAGDSGTYDFVYSPSPTECQAEGEVVFPAEPAPAAGAMGEKVQASISGLVGGTFYTVCLQATNGAGETAFGNPESFKTNAEKPVLLTQSAQNVTPFAATLQAEVNPENETATSCVFEYGKTAITDNSIPCEQIELTGSFAQFATRNLSGLTPGAKYKFRVAVTNSTGTTKGPEEKFETLPAEKPAIAAETVSNIQPFQARLEGTVNPNFQLTHCNFFYGPTLASENKVPCEPEFLEGSGEQGVGTTITGLQPETTYHYQVAVKNASGEQTGESEFTTLPLEAPTVGSESVPFVSTTDAQLEATINPHAQETTFSFEYATEESVVAEGKGTKLPEGTLPPVFEEVGTGPVDLGGKLTPGQTYFYRVIAKNSTGEAPGTIETFTTSPPEPPIVGSENASNVTEQGVSFNASINPVGQEKTTYKFEYATDEGFTKNVGSAEGKEPLFAGNENEQTETVNVQGVLAPHTVYFYRVVATNPVMGTTTGPTQQFHTLGKPSVITGAAQEPTATTAIVSGIINPQGAGTTYLVLYSTEPAYQAAIKAGCAVQTECAYGNGHITSSRSLVATGYTAESTAPIILEELEPSTTYHYVLVATNSTGTTIGPDRTFATPAGSPPPKHAPVSEVPPANAPAFTLPAVLAPLPFTSIAALKAKEAKENSGTVTVPPTRAQLLKKALRACHKKHGSKRKTCEKRAHKRYPAKRK